MLDWLGRLARKKEGQIDLLMTGEVRPEMNGRDQAKRIMSISPASSFSSRVIIANNNISSFEPKPHLKVTTIIQPASGGIITQCRH